MTFRGPPSVVFMARHTCAGATLDPRTHLAGTHLVDIVLMALCCSRPGTAPMLRFLK